MRLFSLSFALCITIPDKFNLMNQAIGSLDHCMGPSFALGRVGGSLTHNNNNIIECFFSHMELFLFKTIFYLIETIG